MKSPRKEHEKLQVKPFHPKKLPALYPSVFVPPTYGSNRNPLLAAIKDDEMSATRSDFETRLKRDSENGSPESIHDKSTSKYRPSSNIYNMKKHVPAGFQPYPKSTRSSQPQLEKQDSRSIPHSLAPINFITQKRISKNAHSLHTTTIVGSNINSEPRKSSASRSGITPSFKINCGQSRTGPSIAMNSMAKASGVKRLSSMTELGPLRKKATASITSTATSEKEPLLSQEQKNIINLVVNKKKSLFFTGNAGTGKSFLLRNIIKNLRKNLKPDEIAVTAPTGIAACNIFGQTLHSFAGCGLGEGSVEDLTAKINKSGYSRQRWQRVKVLVIDEISMVDPDFFDKLEKIAKLVRRNRLPFGGIQIILCGDFMQLPPISKTSTRYCFEAACWDTVVDLTVELTQIFRQRDPVLIKILQEIRSGRLSPESEKILLECARDIGNAPMLYSLRAQVEEANHKELSKLGGQLHVLKAQDSGETFSKAKLDECFLAPRELHLKVGAQAMYIKNHKTKPRLVNGSLGRVIGFHEDNGNPLVDFGDGLGELEVFQEDFCIERPGGGAPLAQRIQYPLVLAFAMSIHKSQGQSLAKVCIDLGSAFEYGQAYVAISRCTSLRGLRVLGFDKSRIKVHPKVVQFYTKLLVAQI